MQANSTSKQIGFSSRQRRFDFAQIAFLSMWTRFQPAKAKSFIYGIASASLIRSPLVPIILFFVYGTLPAFAKKNLISPFPSQISGLELPNSLQIAKGKGEVLRGMRPRNEKDVVQLKNVGVTDILIFRDAPKDEDGVSEEIRWLEGQGYKLGSGIHHIPFRWRDLQSASLACEQTLEALQMMRAAVRDSNKKLFVHCTVGEDRTGYLSALYKMIYEGKPQQLAWKEEMCDRGYADGNPSKPAHVIDAIHKEMTPLFFQMTQKIRKGEISVASLTSESTRKKICAVMEPSPSDLPKCGPSPHFDISILQNHEKSEVMRK